MTTTTHFPENRKASFSLKKVLAPIGKFFVCLFEAIVEARRKKAAFETAQYLIYHNKDFSNWSVGELAMHILDEQNPVGLDKKPTKERQ